FWLLFRRLEKVTRRKGGTPRSRYRSNGYTPTPQEHPITAHKKMPQSLDQGISIQLKLHIQPKSLSAKPPH
ncbi:hypothetical protein, partial [Pseudomonas sp. B10]|uniref:hypothetical protein n=1 Tax=Pseudomonas sp. B10 TaxID=118613 RepID=UPI001C49B3B7